jgi:hypothetical protein
MKLKDLNLWIVAQCLNIKQQGYMLLKFKCKCKILNIIER